MAGIAELLERVRTGGPLRNVPLSFVVAIVNSLADATIDFMIHDPAKAGKHCQVGFETLWRAIA
jgi:predicted methyltransferase